MSSESPYPRTNVFLKIWACARTGAFSGGTDQRVIGIVPIVFDMLDIYDNGAGSEQGGTHECSMLTGPLDHDTR
jgi:hypothetical protein